MMPNNPLLCCGSYWPAIDHWDYFRIDDLLLLAVLLGPKYQVGYKYN